MAKLSMVRVLFCVQLAAFVVLAGWWVSQPGTVRTQHLQAIWQAEAGDVLPPSGLLAGVDWLTAHRQDRLMGMSWLLGLALLIGVSEGWRRRADDPLAGVRVRLWQAGLCGLALMPGLVGGYLVAPWVLPLLPVALGLTGLTAWLGFSLMAGCPA